MYILNKDNNGYITPEEFNKYAELAQIQVFEDYFKDYNDYKNKSKQGKINDGYADLVDQAAQTIDYFTSNVEITKSVSPAVLYPNVVAGVIIGVVISDAGGGYPPNSTGTVTVTGSGTGANITYTVDALGNVSSTTIVSGGTGYTVAILSITNPTTGVISYNLPTDWYYINVVYYNDAEVTRVEQQHLKRLLTSDKTAPTTTYPVYVMKGNNISVYPTTITSALELFYIRFPKVPNWTYTSLSNGEAVFDSTSSTYQDFEIAESELYKIVQKICQYCGVQIKEPEIVQYMMIQNQNDKQEIKSI